MLQLNVLVPFDLVVDVDMGLVKVIQFEYPNPEFFKMDLITGTEEMQQLLMMSRETLNPLCSIVKDPENPEIDDIYQQFLDKEYETIRRLGSNTDLSRLIVATQVYDKNTNLRFTIACKSQYEVDILHKRSIPTYRTITEPDMSKIDIKPYDIIYVKNIYDLYSYDKRSLTKKTIYVANYGFNILFDTDGSPIIPESIIREFGSENEFYIFSLYNFR